MMRRDEAVRALARHITDQIVVAVYQACFDWMAAKPRDLNYVSTGAMGLASSHALGLALGRPDRRVIVLDGDGSLLMNLGSLVTIAAQAPRNLVHFVFQNGTYEANGSHPLPNAERVNFCGFARAAGYRDALAIRDIRTLEAEAARLIAGEGPVLVALHVVPGEPSPQDYKRIHSPEVRAAFRAALAASRPAT